MAACKVIFMPPRREGLGPSAILMTRGMRSINYIDYPAGTRLTAAEKRRATKQLMKGCRELSRRKSSLGGIFDFLKKKPKPRAGSKTIYWVPGPGKGSAMTKRGHGVMRGARRRRRGRR